MAEAVAEKTLVSVEKADGIAVFTLDDPPANTYTHEMMRQLDEAILDARFDVGVQVIVIRGAGEKFFCAGANIDMLSKSDPTWKYYFCLHANETLSRLEHTPKLVIAALNGHTVGGGLEVAMAADLRIARKGAGKIGLPEVTLGVLPGTGGTQRLTRLVGKSKAIELMATGSNMEMEEAVQLGIVNRVIEADSTDAFMEAVKEFAGQFTTPGKGGDGRRSRQARLPVGRRSGAGAGARDRTRAPGQALLEPGRQGGPDRLRREEKAAVRRQVAGALVEGRMLTMVVDHGTFPG
jgi:enoyl-CoA hydratase/carnithine racemase